MLSDLLPLNYRSQLVASSSATKFGCELLSDLLPLNYRSQPKVVEVVKNLGCELLSDLLPLNYRSQHDMLKGLFFRKLSEMFETKKIKIYGMFQYDIACFLFILESMRVFQRRYNN